ncbi:glycosyl transferase family 1, partial [Shigella flexneri]|nr:glycosyl transferase family 1 [Shigella flexneri]
MESLPEFMLNLLFHLKMNGR